MTRKPAYNNTFAIGGVSCSADSLVVKGSLVLHPENSGWIASVTLDKLFIWHLKSLQKRKT